MKKVMCTRWGMDQQDVFRVDKGREAPPYEVWLFERHISKATCIAWSCILASFCVSIGTQMGSLLQGSMTCSFAAVALAMLFSPHLLGSGGPAHEKVRLPLLIANFSTMAITLIVAFGEEAPGRDLVLVASSWLDLCTQIYLQLPTLLFGHFGRLWAVMALAHWAVMVPYYQRVLSYGFLFAVARATFTQSLCYAVYMFCNALERRAYRASLGCSGGDAGCCIAKQGGAAPSRASTQAQGAPFALAGCEPLGSTSAHAQPHADNKQHDTLPAYSSKVRRIRASVKIYGTFRLDDLAPSAASDLRTALQARFQGSAILPVAMRSGCIVVSFDVLRPILPHSDDTSSNADRAQPAGCSPSAVAAAVQHWLQWQQRSTATRALFVQVNEQVLEYSLREGGADAPHEAQWELVACNPMPVRKCSLLLSPSALCLCLGSACAAQGHGSSQQQQVQQQEQQGQQQQPEEVQEVRIEAEVALPAGAVLVDHANAGPDHFSIVARVRGCFCTVQQLQQPPGGAPQPAPRRLQLSVRLPASLLREVCAARGLAGQAPPPAVLCLEVWHGNRSCVASSTAVLWPPQSQQAVAQLRDWVLQHPASAAEFVVDLAQWLELHADPLSSDTEHAGSEGGAATLSASAAHSLSHLHGSEHMLLVGRDLLAHAVYLGQAAIADALLAQLVGPPFCCSFGLLADSGPQTGERGPPSTGLLLAALLSSELGMVEKVLGWGTAHGYRWGRQEAHTTARYLQLLPPGHEQLAQLLHAHALAVELERQGVPPVVCASPLEKVQQPSQPPQTAAREPEGVLADGLPAWKLLRACVQGFDIADASEQEYQHYVFCVSCGFIRPVVSLSLVLLGVGSMKCLLGGVHVHLNFQLALTQGFVVISTGVCMLGALLRSTPEARMASMTWQLIAYRAWMLAMALGYVPLLPFARILAQTRTDSVLEALLYNMVFRKLDKAVLLDRLCATATQVLMYTATDTSYPRACAAIINGLSLGISLFFDMRSRQTFIARLGARAKKE